MPSVYELEKIGTEVGFIGPIKTTMKVIADAEVKNMHNVICGANIKDYHYKNANPKIDFTIDRYADLKKHLMIGLYVLNVVVLVK
ncbi:MAG: hypothetical protein L6V81_00370 [Clostridium sp.]|nr:MAG: hypothetical protein L6V81_00370 [Clostridium sp.]